MSRRGLALLIVVGVLGILAVLAAAFLTLAQLERRASRQRLNATKAALLARSGIEDALARLSAGQEAVYGGEDWNADGLLNPGPETDAQLKQPGVLNVDDCPVSQALRPSFFARTPAGSPALTTVEGRPRGYSGLTQGGGGSYALRVLTGGIHLNGGDPSVPVDQAVPDYNLVLRRVLGTLAEAIDREDGIPGNGPVTLADGLNLIDLRPLTARGWERWEQVRDLAFQADSPSVRQAKLDALRPYLSLHARVDRKVIRPNATEGMEGTIPQSWAQIKLAHETYPALPGTKEPDFERIPVLPAGKLVGRAPVDLAWARTRRPVLIALLAGLKGLTLDESAASAIVPFDPAVPPDALGRILSVQIALDWAPGSDLMTAVDRILVSTSELRTWDAWDAFCESIPFSGTSDLLQAKRDLLKANFNPNSDLNKFGPNASRWKRVDKSDLLAYSTEFSLLPQAGPQELESVGRILGEDGRLLASRVLGALIAPAGLLTLTTQKEFVCEELGDLSVAGDETGTRLPGAPTFISRSAGTGRTWGHALGNPGLGDMGASLQTFPEPVVDPGSGLSTRAADYDGSVQLATVETPKDAFYLVTASSGTPTDIKLLARYTAGLDLDVADATGPPFNNPDGNRNQPDIEQVTYVSGGSDPSQIAYGLLHPTRPNTLYPDGVYSEKDRAPSYFDKGNADGFHGVISFWIKSNHAPPNSTTYRGHPFLKWTNFMDPVTNEGDQFFYLGDAASTGSGGAATTDVGVEDPLVCFFESGHSLNADLRYEHEFARNRELTAHRWSLVTLYYDFRSPADGVWGALRADAGLLDEDKGCVEIYPSSVGGNDPASADDITQDDRFGAHRLVLGAGRPLIEGFGLVKGNTGSGSDSTFDELAIYDFGGAGPGGIPAATPDTLASPGVLAANRFKEGRYYKEFAYTGLGGANTAAEYFSPPIRLGACRIKALAWTQVLPRGLKVGVGGDPGPDGAILLELTDASGGAYLDDAAGKPILGAFRDPASSRVARRVDAPFRLHAVFQPNLDDKENTPILDPLSLDDVTVVYEPLGGRKILAWTGEE